MNNLKTSYAVTFALVLVGMLYGCQQGVIVYEEGALDGYTLISSTGTPGNLSPKPHLIDMLGNVVHRYSENGFYIKPLTGGAAIYGDGYLGNLEFGSVVQEAWDGTVEWTFSEWEDHPSLGWVARQHHDLQREGNPVGYYAPGQDFVPHGNTIILAHADESRPDISSKPLLDDIIYEIDWSGNHSGLFEWHAVDHIDEFGFDALALEDISQTGGDWLHINAISRLGENHWYDEGDTQFHPENIILDSRHGCFIAIIDHQTGDVVWRVGPDYSLGNPEADVGPFIGQHQAHMIPRGLPGEGNILLFDNGGSLGYGGPEGAPKYTRTYSRVVEFDPVAIEIVWEYSPANGDYLPYSEIISGAQRLPNGNTLITSGVQGHLLEVMPDREIVWHYINPQGFPFIQMYRAYRIPPEWLPENPAGYSSWE